MTVPRRSTPVGSDVEGSGVTRAAQCTILLIGSSIAFGVGLSPLGGLDVARITAALFGLSLALTGLAALREKTARNAV